MPTPPSMDDPTLIIEPNPEDLEGPPTLFDGRRPPPGRRRWPMRVLAALSISLLVGTAGLLLGLLSLTRDLPELRSLADYNPPQATVVYGVGGELVARFARERRTLVPFAEIPKVMVDAVLASEDSDFYEHEGVDYLGIVRCVVKNLMAGRKRCGGSTITQQTVKTFFLTPEKTYIRKLRELILAKRVEEALTKDEILFLYLNQIYFGHGAYGVQEASRVYFGKDVSEIGLAEAALLAGLPQSPSRLDPYRNPDRARERRSYVLGRMLDLGVIETEAHNTAEGAPIELQSGEREVHLDNDSHFVAQVRKILSEHPEIGEDRLFTGGLEIQTGLDPQIQAAAEVALADGLRATDKRQGWRGPIRRLEPAAARALISALEAKLESRNGDSEPTSEPMVWDLSPVAATAKNARPEAWAEAARTAHFRENRVFGGIVETVQDAARQAVVSLGPVHVVVPLRSGMSWARPFSIERWTAKPRRVSDVLRAGDIVLVRPETRVEGRLHRWIGTLEQEPLPQGAVVVIDPASREVRALSGGYGSGAGTFNRAVQARRQAGSTFKPVVYAAAFETREFTPVSTCLDAPRVYRDPWTGRSWKPKNYGGNFDGEISLRRALTLSKNLCSVELIDKVGVDTVIAMAQRIGVKSPLPRNLTLALGSGDVTPLEMVNAYATLAAEGRYADPIFIRSVTVSQGDRTVLIQNRAEMRPVLDPAVTYQVVSMMESVVEEGTAQSVQSLQRPVAGKTGTSNEARNAWFIGFTPGLVAGVWVGLDDNRPLGPGETGGRAAIPIWLDTMSAALGDTPSLEFVAPSDVVFALVDPTTGKLAPPEHIGARTEPFLPGTEPTDVLEASEPPERGLWEDYE